MLRIECEGCQHDDGNQEHCFFWSIAVAEVMDRECAIAKVKQGQAHPPVKEKNR